MRLRRGARADTWPAEGQRVRDLCPVCRREYPFGDPRALLGRRMCFECEVTMDPEQSLKDAEQAIRDGDRPTALDRLNAYWTWRDTGGFEPRNGDERAKVLAFAYHRGYL